jgi:hypothetical protein
VPVWSGSARLGLLGFSARFGSVRALVGGWLVDRSNNMKFLSLNLYSAGAITSVAYGEEGCRERLNLLQSAAWKLVVANV